MHRSLYNTALLLISCMTLSSCQTLLRSNGETTAYNETNTVTVLPTTSDPLPITDFTPLFPVELQDNNIAQSPNQENAISLAEFSDNEMNNVAVADPNLINENKSFVLDLGMIKESDYRFPLAGAKVISPFGGKRKHHTGVDLKTCPDDTIVAAFDGVVRMAKPYFGYGNVIVIRHNNGLETLYSHNSKNFVKPGDVVKAGEVIALTGRTGRATTAHLHFEIRVNGQPFNPNLVFNLQDRVLNDHCLLFTKKGRSFAVKSVDSKSRLMAGEYSYLIPSKGAY